jgi:hypothetical protein
VIIDRRAFVAGTALAVLAPAIRLLPAQVASPAPSVPAIRPVVLMIEGWSVEGAGTMDDKLWVRVNRSWRTMWR